MNETIQTIELALGGFKKLRAMIGVENIVTFNKGLTMSFKAKAKDGINCIGITYMDSSDTFQVRFNRYRNHELKCLETMDFIYTEDMKQIIEQRTGLYLSL